MDKYTIDLDKILNDFEYSELTEQNNGYTNSSISQPTFNYTTSDKIITSLPSDTHTYPKIPTSKHSINNVFHSLNEYLNSDIKDFPKTEVTQEIETSLPTYVSTPQTSIQDIFKNVDSYGQNNLLTTNSDISLPSTSVLTSDLSNKTIKPSYNVSCLSSDVSLPSTSSNSDLTYPSLTDSNLKNEATNLSLPSSSCLDSNVLITSTSDDIAISTNLNLSSNIHYPSTSLLENNDTNSGVPDVENINYVKILSNNVSLLDDNITNSEIDNMNSKIKNISSNNISNLLDHSEPNLTSTEFTDSNLICPITNDSTTDIEHNLSNLQSSDKNTVLNNSNLKNVTDTEPSLASQNKNTNIISDMNVSDIKSNFSNEDLKTEPNLNYELSNDPNLKTDSIDSNSDKVDLEFCNSVDNGSMNNFMLRSDDSVNILLNNQTDVNPNLTYPNNSDIITSEVNPIDLKNSATFTKNNLTETSEIKVEKLISPIGNDNLNIMENILDFHPEEDVKNTHFGAESELICTNNFQSEILPEETYSDTDTIEIDTKNNITKDSDSQNVVNNNTSQILHNGNNQNNDLEETQENTILKKTPIKITFDDFDISDSEMENELAQLEQEYNEKIAQETSSNESDNVEEADDMVPDETAVPQDDIKIEDNLSQIEAQDTVDNDVIKVEAETSLVIETENLESQNVSKNDIDVQEDQVTSTEVENTDVKMEASEDVLPEETKNVEEHSSEQKRENFALLRPNSLDLNPESPENNVIGNPGSTPYTNPTLSQPVDSSIVSTSTPTKSADQQNTSLSPTTSEASSTSEPSDSPNTSDSCNDTSLEDPPVDPVKMLAKAENKTESEEGHSGSGDERREVTDKWLGKTAPFWTPDSDALSCLHCNQKFTVIKRRHHCRACGLVLCSKCCSMKYKLPYMDNQEARVCSKCFDILSGINPEDATPSSGDRAEDSDIQATSSGTQRVLNPGNPMDYCSVVPPLQQVGNLPTTPPSVMVPVGVLKRKGSGKSRGSKSVMFCDGIRPGCDLTELDYDFNYKSKQTTSRSTPQPSYNKMNRNLPKIDTKTNSYIPTEENSLPPTVTILKSEISYTECANNQSVVEMLKNETLTFAVQRNLYVHVKIINMDCCINKHAWCFTTEGMIAVGQDEIVILLEFVDNEKTVPKDMFLHLNNIYNEAVKGTSITEMGLSIHNTSNFLESKNHAGFLYVKPTFQCVQNVIIPKEPYLIGILIHRWETPWAKIFPLRLLLRLGAEYRYYPSPIISTRHRESVYVEIGHTIINLLADFRNFSYTLPNVRGLTIHMKDKNTTVSVPINRYDQVMRALNNSSDHILAFAANFSPKADSHLVCIQDTHGNNENAYTTHAINIHNKPRKVTGASFIVLNGALKSTSGLTAKSSIVEDGLMIQILPEQMVKLRNALRNMKDFKINCGCVNAHSDESVNIVWTENDVNFNVGVNSPIDNMALSGVPSIRVHNGKDYICNSGNKLIRWTEVFIIQSGDENLKTQDPVDISKLSESISKATCQALVKYLDLLATNSFLKIGIRTTLHIENVSYMAGSNGVKLPPIYMKSLDNELIPILHKITSNNLGESAIVIELIFHILNM